jgi:hypothetical protein
VSTGEAQAAMLETFQQAIEAGQVIDIGPRDEIEARTNTIELLVVEIIRQTERTFGIKSSDWPDGALAEHNVLIRRAWKELDGLTRLAAARKAGQP